MSQDQFNQNHLSNSEHRRLVEVLYEEHGGGVSKSEFPDRVLRLLEDVPGLELISDSEAKPIINKLWSLYHDQSQ